MDVKVDGEVRTIYLVSFNCDENVALAVTMATVNEYCHVLASTIG